MHPQIYKKWNYDTFKIKSCDNAVDNASHNILLGNITINKRNLVDDSEHF